MNCSAALSFRLGAVALALAFSGAAQADDFSPDALSAGAAPLAAAVAKPLVAPAWMSPEVGDAWAKGYKGQGTRIIVVDDFSSSSRFSGNLGDGVKTLRHGEWTAKEAMAVAPAASAYGIDYNSGASSHIQLGTGLNVINASYGLMAKSGYLPSQINYGVLQSDVIKFAKSGTAIVTKAAGNDAVAVNAAYKGNSDYLNLSLRGAPSALFVGALNKNGTVASKASMASYSNVAGSDPVYQRNFLVVGVQGNQTGLYGTSFAAPIVNGYASILGSKFTKATPTQITNQLLGTARQDTVSGYNPAIHGRGEASLTRALAPVSIK